MMESESERMFWPLDQHSKGLCCRSRGMTMFFSTLLCAVLTLVFVGQNAQAQPKRLAPGVLKIIEPTIDARDSYSLPLPLEGLESVPFSPNYAPILETLHGQSKQVVFYRDVWQYEFGFLGLRQARLKLRGQNGTFDYENVWYLVYRIRDTGKNVSYAQVEEDGRFGHLKNEIKRDQQDFQITTNFLPNFYLKGWVKPSGGRHQRVNYLDQIDPEALKQIRKVEDRDRYLLDKVEMMNARIPRVKSVSDDGIWGVAIWRNVDPRIDYVSVNVTGLTNAFRINSDQPVDRTLKQRNLQLNFWRPGDRVRQNEDQVVFGIPLVDNPIRQIEICKRYDLPGPLLRGYVSSKTANQNVLVLEMDADIQFSTFKSTVTPMLDKGQLPPAIRAAFAKSGVEVGNGAKVTTLIAEQKWSLTGSIDGEEQQLSLVVEPQYWEPKGEGIRFINSLEHLWIYR